MSADFRVGDICIVHGLPLDSLINGRLCSILAVIPNAAETHYLVRDYHLTHLTGTLAQSHLWLREHAKPDLAEDFAKIVSWSNCAWQPTGRAT